MSLEDKKKLLQFVTGSDRVPLAGMSSLKFTIQKNGDGGKYPRQKETFGILCLTNFFFFDSRLPTSHTCFSVLLLPVYPSKAALEVNLTTAIQNCTGFGLA